MKFSLLLVLSVGNTVFQTVLALVGVPGGIVTAAIAGLSTIALADAVISPGRGVNYRRIRLMLALPILATVSLAWSLSPDLGASKLTVFAGRAILPAVGLAIWASAFGGWQRAQQVLPRVVRSLLYLTLILTVAFGDTSRFTDRAEVGGTNPIWLGRSIVMLVVLLVALEVRPPSKATRNVDLLAVTATLVLLGARGPIAAYFVFLIWLLHTGGASGVLSPTQSVDRGSMRRLVSSIVLGLAATLVGFGLVPLGRFESVFGPDRDNSSEARVRNLELAWEQFTSRPLAGSGVGGFQGTREGAYPHNLIAEIGVELGLLGLLIMLVLLNFVLRKGDAEPAVKMGVIVGLCVALFSGNLGGNEGMWLFIGLAIGLSRRKTTDDEISSVPVPGDAHAT